jgi:hypothetical protein
VGGELFKIMSDVGMKLRNFLRAVLHRVLLYRRIPLFLVLLLIILLVVYGSYAFIEMDPRSNVFCVLCHDMRPFYLEHATGPHSHFNCHVCHPLTLDVLKEPVIYILYRPSAEEIRVRTLFLYDECVKCHSVVELSKDRIHETHLGLARRVSCSACHSSHLMDVRNDDCLQCHNYQRVVSSHLNFHAEAERLAAQGVVTCQRCHQTLDPTSLEGVIRGATCFDCHSTPLKSVVVEGRMCVECHR